MNKPEYSFGDLVQTAGYWPRVFRIVGMREEHYYYPDENWTDIVYELTDVVSAEWLEADELDLTLVAEVERADEWLRDNPPPAAEPTGLWAQIFYDEIGGGDEMSFMFGGGPQQPKEPRKPTARELSAQEAERRKQARKEKAAQVDALLDEYNDTKVLAEMFPEDGGFKAKAGELLAKLAEVSGK